ncbi:hypothetical protein JCM8547_000357 [Rhodosporidiobolus lusitaniae]
MLDRLPVELLLDILELTLPPETTYYAYRERQNVLHDYSRKDLALVLPASLERSVHLQKHICVLQLKNTQYALDSFFDTIGRLPNLVGFRLEEPTHRLREEDLSRLGNVRKLIFRDVVVQAFSSSIFPNLESLTLHSVQVVDAHNQSISARLTSIPSASFTSARAPEDDLAPSEELWQYAVELRRRQALARAE